MHGIEHFERHIGETSRLPISRPTRQFPPAVPFALWASGHGYVRRRLAKAASALPHSRVKIIEITLDTGFQSQQAFRRAFRKVYHTTPAIYRMKGRDVP